jgi:hypothetical protein
MEQSLDDLRTRFNNHAMVRISSSLGILIVLSFSLGCDETLPPRDEPQRYLQASYSVVEGAVEIRDSVAVGFGGRLVVSVKNIYAEVLQGDEYARADFDVWFRDVPDRTGTITASRRDLTDQSLIYAGQLTLRPNVTATFLKHWEHKTTSGRYFWEFVSLHFVSVPFTNGYWESDSVRLVARGRVQLFKTRAPQLLSPIQFTFVYRLWVP